MKRLNPTDCDERCDEPNGYQAHRRRNENPCTTALKARARYMKKYRRERGLTKAELVPHTQQGGDA